MPQIITNQRDSLTLLLVVNTQVCAEKIVHKPPQLKLLYFPME